MKGWKTINTQMTPNTLKQKWANAARLACVLAVSAARLAVIVVPMFSPNTSAAPSSRLIQPLAHIINVIAMVAAEGLHNHGQYCTDEQEQNNGKESHIRVVLYEGKHFRIGIQVGGVCFQIREPHEKERKTKNEFTDGFAVAFSEKMSGRAMAKRGRAKAAISTLNPKN